MILSNKVEVMPYANPSDILFMLILSKIFDMFWIMPFSFNANTRINIDIINGIKSYGKRP